MEDYDPEVDWVTARAKCTGAEVFQGLKANVRKDVDIRNSLRDKEAPYGFKFTDNGNEFTVLLMRNRGERWVQFRYEGDTLIATDQSGKRVIEATLTLSGAGNCRLAMEHLPGQAIQEWAFRHMALEKLFFVEPVSTTT